MNQPHAVLAGFVDLSKAFNRVDHSLLIQDLYDMHTPAWLLNILVSYLSDRSMIMSYMGEISSSRVLPGGGPQGALLGGIIFMVKFNSAFLRPPIPPHVRGPVLKSTSQSVKFVDDGTVAVSIDLKSCLAPDPTMRPKPLNFHERTEQVLPSKNNLLQYYMDDTENFAQSDKLVINKQKCKVMTFNKSRKRDFPPEISFSDNIHLECVSDFKLVGIILSDDLKWEKNTQYICKKAMKKLWVLRRMVNLGLETHHIFDTYTKEVRSLLELAVPVWHSGLTKRQTAQIERVQKTAFHIILAESYTDYEVACTLLNTEPLEYRRQKLCLKFAKKDVKKESTLFSKVSKPINTRRKPKLVHEYKCRTSRFRKSSLPYLSRLLNSQV